MNNRVTRPDRRLFLTQAASALPFLRAFTSAVPAGVSRPSQQYVDMLQTTQQP